MKANKKLLPLFLFFVIILITYIVYFSSLKSQWVLNGIFLLILLVLLYLFPGWLLINKTKFYLIIMELTFTV